jgi:hypothetical protein
MMSSTAMEFATNSTFFFNLTLCILCQLINNISYCVYIVLKSCLFFRAKCFSCLQ